MRYHVDSSSWTHLPMCRDCGWRGDPEASKIAALVALQRHQHRAHPDDRAGKDLDRNAARARRRAAGLRV